EQTRRRATVFTTGGAVYGLGVAPTANNLGMLGAPAANTSIGTNPDIVANIRWDGAWGAFQVAGAMHDVSAGYYGALETTGHPGNKWGWTVSPGLRINFPMIGPGDYLQVAYHYAQGAVQYTAGATPSAAGYVIYRGSSLGYGNFEDGVYGASPASIELT